MLDTLLESRVRAERSTASTVASVAAHSALIAGALFATAQACVEVSKSPEVVRAVYFPIKAAQTAKPLSGAHSMAPLSELKFVGPKIDIEVPRVDVILPPSAPGDFTSNPVGNFGTNRSAGAPGAPGGVGEGTFRADQVEKQVALLPGGNQPRYPELLRSAGIEGQVTAQFVVDEEGRVEEKSVRFIRSDNHLFEDAVRTALGRMRFAPAETGGRKVRQLVEMPFVFTLSR